MRLSSLLVVPAIFLLGPRISVAQGPEVIPGEVLVMLNPGATAEVIANDLVELNGDWIGMHVVKEVSAPMRVWKLRFDPATAEQYDVLRAVRNHPEVQLAQNNHRLKQREVPNDSDYGQQWHHQNINSEAAWDINTGGVTATGDTIVVCIIENSDLPHPDLIANAWYNHAEIPNNGIDDDGNGYVDDFRGWSPNNDNDNVYGGGHGTQVAGMIGAVGNNASGVAGANWAVKMMVVSNSGASDEGVIASHTYPLIMRRRYNESNGAEGAFVVATNASWGINGGQPADAPLWCAMYDTLGTAGILNCGATSNSNVDVDAIGDLPTACPSDFMIDVTATNVDDNRTFSGYGLTTIDVGAPGEDVYTTRINGGYGTTTGTSFASPLTAGVIGLLYSAPCASMMTLVKGDPEEGARFIREKLFEGVDQVGNLAGQTVTGGRINAGTSMQLIMNTCGSCPSPYNLTAQGVAVGTSVLGWTAVSGSTFDLRYRALGSGPWTEVNDIAQNSYEVNDLERCSAYEFQVRVQCDEELSDHSNAFVWTSEGCCSAPSGSSAIASSDDRIEATWEPVFDAVTYDVRYQPVGSSTWTVIPGVVDPTVEIAPLTPCTNYTVQVRTQCAELTSDWTASANVRTSGCGACVDNTYCTSNSDDAGSEWIARVRIGAIDNNTASDAGYGDYTALSTDLALGMPHAFTLAPGYSGFAFNEWFRIWVDLDHDGDFDTEEELVFDTNGRSNAPVNASLTVPTSATVGPTRMRVVMRYNVAPGSPCESNYDYGETEDYCVNLIVGPTDVGSTTLNAITTLYPQPADQQLYVRLADGAARNGLNMIVFDATGRRIMEAPLIQDRNVLSTAGLSNGLYTFVLVSNGRMVDQGRFAVLHGN
ncbi:MAG: S8 family serine peptidase [Flavobacteriales bacterium]